MKTKSLFLASLPLSALFALGLCSCTIRINRNTYEAAPVETPTQVADAGRSEPNASQQVDSGAAPPPSATASVSGLVQPDPNVYRPEVVAPTPELVQSLEVPPGFNVQVYASNLGHARMLSVYRDRVYLTRPMQGDVLLLSQAADAGVPVTPSPAIEALPGVHGIAFSGDRVYLATITDVWSAELNADGSFGTPSVIHSGLPEGGQHPYRTLGVGPDGALYISVGSTCDACVETNPEHAAILRAPSAGQRSVFAKGLRNTIGFGWHPLTHELWGMDHGSDLRGDTLPPEELNKIVEGGNYGWPYCFADRKSDPLMNDPPDTTKAAYCANTQATTLLNDAHGAPIAMLFYNGKQFPGEYVNDAFVAMRGSWNRFPPSGYQVNRIRFDAAGRPLAFEPFVRGFLINGGTQAFARIAGLAVHPDGSLLISDDTNGVVYRVAYE